MANDSECSSENFEVLEKSLQIEFTRKNSIGHCSLQGQNSSFQEARFTTHKLSLTKFIHNLASQSDRRHLRSTLGLKIHEWAEISSLKFTLLHKIRENYLKITFPPFLKKYFYEQRLHQLIETPSTFKKSHVEFFQSNNIPDFESIRISVLAQYIVFVLSKAVISTEEFELVIHLLRQTFADKFWSLCSGNMNPNAMERALMMHVFKDDNFDLQNGYDYQMLERETRNRIATTLAISEYESVILNSFIHIPTLTSLRITEALKKHSKSCADSESKLSANPIHSSNPLSYTPQ